MKNSLIIYSGGMDSTTMLYEYKNDIAIAISFIYGSKHNQKEIKFAKYHCKKLGIKHITINLSFINKYFQSSLLLNGGDIPDGHYQSENMKSTVVPFRNGIMLSVAIGVAESEGLKYVYIANHSGDHDIYPDCRNTFISAINEAAAYGTYNNINIKAPYTNINKREIALKGKFFGIEYDKTWTCYKGLEKHCGLCGSCTERKEALNGFDNTDYIC